MENNFLQYCKLSRKIVEMRFYIVTKKSGEAGVQYNSSWDMVNLELKSTTSEPPGELQH